jgi:hypothetical protein
VLQPTPGHSEILYARPDTEVAGAQYRWGNDVVPDAMPLKAALAFAGSVNGTRALEIRLLHASGAQETLYSVDLGSLQTAPRWQGSENAKLIIRGQLEGSAARGRALTTVVPYRIIAGLRLTRTIVGARLLAKQVAQLRYDLIIGASKRHQEPHCMARKPRPLPL